MSLGTWGRDRRKRAVHARGRRSVAAVCGSDSLQMVSEKSLAVVTCKTCLRLLSSADAAADLIRETQAAAAGMPPGSMFGKGGL